MKPETFRTAFGQRLRAARLKADLSQHTLAQAAGLTQSGIAQIERGLKLPSLPAAWALAEALGVSLDTLCPPPKRPAR